MSRSVRCLPALILGLLLQAHSAAAAPVLVDAAWVEARLTDPKVVLVDMSDPMQYQRFHLPGAVYLPFDQLVQRRKDGVALRVPDQRLYEVLGALGISADKHVVIYDDMGGLNAGRLFWELERIGHAEVSVLDGGLVGWILSGRKVIAEPVEPKAAKYAPAGGKGRANEIDHASFRQVAESNAAAILDVRTGQEYVGMPPTPRSGHVPGAQWWPWDGAVAFDQQFTRKPVPELLASLGEVGVTDKAKPVVTYCRSGHRAAQAYLTLRSLGFEDVRLYDGSMLEYERDASAPVKKGQEP